MSTTRSWSPIPRTDPDVGDISRRLTETAFLPTWFAQRSSGALGPEEQVAAQRTAIHAATPTVAHADSLGRTFLTIAHNDSGAPATVRLLHPPKSSMPHACLLDIEGNEREVIDAKDRVVMRYDYDLLGNRILQASMEAGKRWMIE